MRAAVSTLTDKFEIQKVENLEDIMKYNILSTPGLVVDEKLMIYGKVASVDEILQVLKS